VRGGARKGTSYRDCEHISDYAKKLFNFDESKYQPWAKNISHLFKKSEHKTAILLIKDSSKKFMTQETNKLL
jgi:hypothetical protein